MQITISLAAPVNTTLDKFSITKLYANAPGGREWISKWDNGHARTWTDQANDPYDSEFWTRYKGSGTYRADGNGTLKISGSTPRMYVIDPSWIQSWHNVEITVYGKRISDSNITWGGIMAYARTNHMLDKDYCDTRGYGGRFRYDGAIDFEKETKHGSGYYIAASKSYWSGGMIKNTWIGYKYVVYDLSNGNVKLELWMDKTDGTNGGNWIKIDEFIDNGHNFGVGGAACAGINPALRLNISDYRPGSESGKPNLAVYFKSDGVGTDGLWYKKASIREIVPIRIAADITPPAVNSTNPLNSATNVSPTKIITVTFNENIRQGVNYGSISFKDSSNNLINATKSISDNILTIDPVSDLAYNKTYTVFIPQRAVKDVSNNDLATAYTFSFTTSVQKAVQFDGDGSYVEVPDHNDFSVTTTRNLTVSFWLRPDALDFSNTDGSPPEGARVEFLGKGESVQDQMEWYFRMYNRTNATRANRISFYIFNLIGGNGVGSYFQDNVTVGKWIHVVGKIDNRYTYIYKNGILRDKDDYTAGSIRPQNGKAPLRIGTVTKSSYIKGAIDDITIYNRSLTDTEVANIYNGIKPRDGIVAEWLADEGSGSYLYDSSGRNHNGRLYGNTTWTTGYGS